MVSFSAAEPVEVEAADVFLATARLDRLLPRGLFCARYCPADGAIEGRLTELAKRRTHHFRVAPLSSHPSHTPRPSRTYGA